MTRDGKYAYGCSARTSASASHSHAEDETSFPSGQYLSSGPATPTSGHFFPSVERELAISTKALRIAAKIAKLSELLKRSQCSLATG
jgi:hypothetical protein